MSLPNPLLRYIIAGQLKRNYTITTEGTAAIDVPGGSLLYAAVGARIWDENIGLLGRVGEDYPQQWLDKLERLKFDRRGIIIIPEALDLRDFNAYPDPDTRQTSNPVSHFTRLGLSFPRALLDYTAPVPQLDSRTHLNPGSIRTIDIPPEYLDASAVHICPMDYLTHHLLPSAFRQGNVQNITLDPAEGYMNPVFWEDIPSIVHGLTAFISSEEKVRTLFKGRSEDIWEMIETLAGYGCEIIVIKRGNRGQYLYDAPSREKWAIPTYPSKIIDPTGAGDAFCGGFLAGYRLTYNPLKAALCGNISSSMVMEDSIYNYALNAMPDLATARMEALGGRIRKL